MFYQTLTAKMFSCIAFIRKVHVASYSRRDWTNRSRHRLCSIFSTGKSVVSTVLMIHLLCHESHPGCCHVFTRYQYSKQVCGRLFMCGDISKCHGLNLSRLCSEMLLMIAVPVTAVQLGAKDRSSMVSTSEASLSAGSCPRISTW